MRVLRLLCLSLIHAVHAVKFPFEVRTVSVEPSSHLHPRDSVPIKNIANSIYVTNITLGGTIIPVMLDTGSSDLWVTGTVPNAQDSGKSKTLDYAVGKASGDIYYADLTLSNLTVTNQAFLLVENTTSFSTNITAQGYSGLIGLGPNTGSLIRDALDRKDYGGDATLDRIFQLNKTTQNFISFMLDRKNDPSSTIAGQFTISELIKGYENISNQPQLDVVTVPGLTDRDQHWQMYTDVDGIIGPDGQPIKYSSIVPKAPKGQLVAVIDSGFTLPQVPRVVSDAIYGRVQGAAWNAANSVWTIPCTQMLNISLKFGGVEFPIHPLDTSSSDFGLTDSSGKAVCVGTLQPITSAFSLLGEYDLILGMSFLRNTYTLIDFGKFVEGASNDQVHPYVQLLSMTDVTAAHADFVKVRLNGIDTTGDSSYYLLPASEGLSSPESSAEKKAHLAEKVLSRWPLILMGCLILVFALAAYIAWRCCCRRRWAERKQAKAANAGGGEGLKGMGKRLSVSALQMNPLKSAGSYYPIDEPAPPPAAGHSPAYAHNHPPSYHSGYRV